jgi:hypothetical protein
MTQPKGKAAQERMQEDARRTVLESGEFRTTSDLAKLLRIDSHKLDRQLNVWKDRNEIFSIDGGPEDQLFPKFAFDRNRGLQLFEAIPQILGIFGTKLSRLAIASWFIADCSYLDDQPPKDVLQADPDWVIDAARDEMEEVSHG